MRRFACEFAAFALLAACSTEELAPLPPDLPIESGGGSGGASGGAAPAGSSGVAAGGTSAVSGSGSALGGATGSGPGASGASSGAGGVVSHAGQGGQPPNGCADCAALKSALVHRYDFEGEGSQVMDRVGTDHGTVEAGGSLSQVSGKGVVALTGGAEGPYVDLPNGLVSSLTSVTLETWVTWAGGDAWQRIFDFGSSSAVAEGTPADGKTYLFVTPTAGADGVLRGVYSLDGSAEAAETRVSGAAALPQALTQVVLVVNSAGQQLELYVNGESAGGQPFTGSLADLEDVNCWLGRSQFDSDPGLVGTLHDFRIYGAALNASQIATSFANGPDPAFLFE